jgi:exodeoxyribonuclease-3
MRVATFNVNSIRSRVDIVTDWLRRHQPDVLALQETKVEDALFPVESFAAEGYHVTHRGEKAYNGVAFLTRKPPVRLAAGFDDGEHADATRLLRVEIDGVHFVNTYIPQGRDLEHPQFAYKLDWYKRLHAWFARHYHPETPLIWLGDLNVARLPIDVFNPHDRAQHVCYHESVRSAFRRCCDWGFEDTFRLHCPAAGQYTFFSYRRTGNVETNKGWRLDYIMATAPMARACTHSYIDLEPRRHSRPSDHAVMVSEFDL